MNVITTEIQVFNRALGVSLPATVLGKRLHHFRKERWCPDSESNQGHGDFQSPALPTELSGQRGVLNPIPFGASILFPSNLIKCRFFLQFTEILISNVCFYGITRKITGGQLRMLSAGKLNDGNLSAGRLLCAGNCGILRTGVSSSGFHTLYPAPSR